MKSTLTLGAVALVAALSSAAAQAQTAAPLTRAEVQAEYLRARAAGELDFALYEVLRAPRRAAEPPATAAAAGRDAAPQATVAGAAASAPRGR